MWPTGGLPVTAELVKQLAHTQAWWFDSKMGNEENLDMGEAKDC